MVHLLKNGANHSFFLLPCVAIMLSFQPFVISVSLSIIAMSCAAQAVNSVSNTVLSGRRLQFDSIAGFEPKTDVTDHVSSMTFGASRLEVLPKTDGTSPFCL